MCLIYKVKFIDVNIHQTLAFTVLFRKCERLLCDLVDNCLVSKYELNVCCTALRTIWDRMSFNERTYALELEYSLEQIIEQKYLVYYQY